MGRDVDELQMAAVDKTVGFLGGGMMASALMGGLVKAGVVTSTSKISVSEPYAPLREKHTAAGFFTSASNIEVVRRSDVLFLAVKVLTLTHECLN